MNAKTLGGMLLVAGCCIGAGMLALPVLTGLSGFFPSLSIMLLAWAFMMFTGLLLIEVNGWFKTQVNFLTMTKELLGQKGRAAAWVSYLLLFYSLLVAYMAASGTVFSAILSSFFSLAVPPWIASVFFTLLFGYIVYLGTRTVDLFNRYLMIGLIATYLGMIGIGLFRVNPELLLHTSPHYLFLSLPILIVSFGFHNMVPSITAYMDGNLKQTRWAIVGGSLITLAIYLIWSYLVLGTVPADALLASYEKGEEATIPLNAILGSSWLGHFSQGFAFFAIITSFLAQGLTLTHFLADGFKIQPTQKNLHWLCFLAMTPPLIFALRDPTIFFKMLSFAGGVCATVLFGILPACMAWVGRYRKKHPHSYRVPGGKPSLLIAGLFALFVMACELSKFF